MSPHKSCIPSFPTSLPPKDAAPRRYKDAPTVLTPSGYIVEWCPTHPKATHGTYFQHRLVMECQLGRFLTKQERVHHRDHDRTNNKIDNLVLHASHSEHMRAHWDRKGRNDPELIARVREAASDPTKGLDSLGIPATTIHTICKTHGIKWVPCSQRGISRLLTEETVRGALQGRTTIQGAALLFVSVATLYNRFGHLLTKRPSPGFLDAHRVEILDLVYRQRIARTEVARRFETCEAVVTKSIQRWLRQGGTEQAVDGATALDCLDELRPLPADHEADGMLAVQISMANPVAEHAVCFAATPRAAEKYFKDRAGDKRSLRAGLGAPCYCIVLDAGACCRSHESVSVATAGTSAT
jgi:transposase-like protein